MRQYEVMYILRPELEQEKVQELVAKFQELVQNFGGQITNLKEMGKKRIAYEIDRLREGYYVLMNFESEPAAVEELDRVMKITDPVVRHLIVREDE